ncbi:murein L,D-transpeptidase [Flavihumibacter stibioxidans]|uniref:L,D-TPase catalytic domain-containing protein n=1 Tax=Flavihumibacter stibioxidans TaxID=1834163 RepID=A0ABR7M6U2_9BACT|nr:L,D-transpeptidase family protein [Flavihumibacter stibioxidans]MBC6490756.1 hypothetical protein [Flavihumibacter stibioxidans]
MKPLSFFLALCLAFAACKQSSSNGHKMAKIARDTAISDTNSFSTLFFDSTSLETWLAGRSMPDTAKALFRNFYNQRNYQYAWFDSTGIAEQAGHFWNLQQNYLAYSGDSSIFNPYLQRWADSVNSYGPKAIPDSARLLVEWGLTGQFFRYANKAYMGDRRLNARDLEWFIPRKRVDLLSMLDTLVRVKGKDIDRYEPVNKQYGLLREQLKRYYEIERQGAWDPLVAKKKKLVTGDTGMVILQVKKRLALTGDLPLADSSNLFTPELEAAVKHFQFRYGLKEDGVIGGATLREMSTPIRQRIHQILVNMERIRWVPAEPSGNFLLVNIPEFRLHVIENGKQAFSMNVVVGTSQNNTVIFTGKLKYVVFSPYWNVPPGILKKEILPAIRRNPNYLERHDMEWFGNGQVRQRPGPKNSLGLVKFLFPNNYNIYLHDTPSKSLFNESKRAFSHGCIRVEEPLKLAEWILSGENSWTTDNIIAAMYAGKERFVNVKKDIPVFIGYFTAWVDQQGNLNFRDDLYGHDKKMAAKMFRSATP